MDTIANNLHPNHKAVVERFIQACQQDTRILAAFIGGSYASGASDEFSDLDLCLIVSDLDFDDFNATRYEFIHQLGEPLFIESFNNPNNLFYILADGTEGELGFRRESEFIKLHSGPYQTLVDKKHLLTGVEFPYQSPDPAEQVEKLRRLIFVFWHELSHFTVALGRDQLWWAQGQLEALRRFCVNLARMSYNFLDPEIGDEPYFKIDKIMPVEQLAVLKETFCPQEKSALLNSFMLVYRLYKEYATPLAQEHGIPYPQAREILMIQRLADLKMKFSM